VRVRVRVRMRVRVRLGLRLRVRVRLGVRVGARFGVRVKITNVPTYQMMSKFFRFRLIHAAMIDEARQMLRAISEKTKGKWRLQS
jgi:hypothetical protein